MYLGKKDLTALVKKIETEVSNCRKMRASLATGATFGPLKDGLQQAETNLCGLLDIYHESLAAEKADNAETDADFQGKVEEAKGNLDAIQAVLKDAAEKLADSKKKAKEDANAGDSKK